MSWKELYNNKIVSADAAVKKIKSGDRVVFGQGVGEPVVLIDALLKNASMFRDVKIAHMGTFTEAEYATREYSENFLHYSFFAFPATRKRIHEGNAVYVPCHFRHIPLFFSEKIYPVDVALIMVSAPDEHGYCSYGVSVDYTKGAAENAKIVIAEVTPGMPRTFGDSMIHISNIDYIVETNSKPALLAIPEITETDNKIGANIAELINDGDCLQLGIGALPDAILHFLTDKKDLGIHSEMISDGVVKLVEDGVITCSRKNFHKDKIIATFLMGTEKLYNFVDNNPFVEMYPVDYVNNPGNIAKNDNMVSVNAALQIDLTGQVVADSIGYKQFSGSGGQIDFVRGTSFSKGGKSIIGFHSTAAGGKLSRIVLHIDEGASVTTPRTDVHYIVTEYGVVNLRGKSVPERAKALIDIAHPDFREALSKNFFDTYKRCIG